MVRAGRPRSWSAVDRAMLHLVRLVLADDWTVTAAAHRLRERVGDPSTLRRMSIRVEHAWVERPSEIAGRAAWTVRHALAADRAVAS